MLQAVRVHLAIHRGVRLTCAERQGLALIYAKSSNHTALSCVCARVRVCVSLS